MGQGWPGIVGADKIRLSRADIVERFETIRSLFGGETAPADPVPGQPWWKDSTGELSVWSETAGDWISLTTRPSALPGYTTPEEHGAVGVLPSLPVVDCKTAILAAIATGKRVMFDASKVYGVNGTMTVCTTGQTCWMENFWFEQMNPNDSARRTIWASGGNLVVLKNGKVNRNGNGLGGSISDAAGVWIANVLKVEIDGLEVWGNDKGKGVALYNNRRLMARGIHVRDILAGGPAHSVMTDDVIEGLTLGGNELAVVEAPLIENLRTQWTGQAAWGRFTRNIAIVGGGNARDEATVLIAPRTKDGDQAIDLSGSDNVRGVTIIAPEIYDPISFGVKFANTVTHCTLLGGIIKRPGYAGVIMSANGSGLTPQTQKIVVQGVHVVAPGGGPTYWKDLSATISGAAVWTQGLVTDFPRSIIFRDCVFDGAGGYMHFGIDAQPVLGGSGSQWVEQEGCMVYSPLTRNFRGLHQGWAQRRRVATQSLSNATWTAISTDDTVADRMLTGGIAADVFRMLREGVYQANASLVFASSATGSRSVRITRKRGSESVFSEVPGTYQRVPASAVGEMAFLFSAPLEVRDSDQFKLEVQQDSGGALNVTATITFVMLQKGSAI